MARSPKNTTKRQTGRPTRPTASTSFQSAPEDAFDMIQDDDIAEDDDMDVEGSEDSTEMINRFLAEYNKRQAKKSSARSAAFQTQKKNLYTAARKASKELARDGTACLEEGKAKLLALKQEEVTADQYSKDVIPSWHRVEDSVKELLSVYPAGLEDLFPRRSDAVNAASEMIETNSARRADALAECVEAADAQLYQSKLDEKNAADASRLIKHYKTLLTI
ncbi:unnamed protein product [Mycena citricolor]|uniref:Uncharacterized protein n=1 Tax=Mycena citricolor TaxID=2018698 RepID=A0AAD2HKD6_9AGAR|nr:unnamed protein product [Mycena citricolor]